MSNIAYINYTLREIALDQCTPFRLALPVSVCLAVGAVGASFVFVGFRWVSVSIQPVVVRHGDIVEHTACDNCDAALFRSESESSCQAGKPSFQHTVETLDDHSSRRMSDVKPPLCCSARVWQRGEDVSQTRITAVTKDMVSSWQGFQLILQVRLLENSGIVSASLPASHDVPDDHSVVAENLNIEGEPSFPVAVGFGKGTTGTGNRNVRSVDCTDDTRNPVLGVERFLDSGELVWGREVDEARLQACDCGEDGMNASGYGTLAYAMNVDVFALETSTCHESQSDEHLKYGS